MELENGLEEVTAASDVFRDGSLDMMLDLKLRERVETDSGVRKAEERDATRRLWRGVLIYILSLLGVVWCGCSRLGAFGEVVGCLSTRMTLMDQSPVVLLLLLPR